jgi:hypothetical protein
VGVVPVVGDGVGVVPVVGVGVGVVPVVGDGVGVTLLEPLRTYVTSERAGIVALNAPPLTTALPCCAVSLELLVR